MSAVGALRERASLLSRTRPETVCWHNLLQVWKHTQKQAYVLFVNLTQETLPRLCQPLNVNALCELQIPLVGVSPAEVKILSQRTTDSRCLSLPSHVMMVRAPWGTPCHFCTAHLSHKHPTCDCDLHRSLTHPQSSHFGPASILTAICTALRNLAQDSTTPIRRDPPAKP